MTNELLDNCKSRDELRTNEIVIEMMKSLKTAEPKLRELIEQNLDEEDVMNVCLVVNEDLQKTFTRFRAIKEN